MTDAHPADVEASAHVGSQHFPVLHVLEEVFLQQLLSVPGVPSTAVENPIYQNGDSHPCDFQLESRLP